MSEPRPLVEVIGSLSVPPRAFLAATVRLAPPIVPASPRDAATRLAEFTYAGKTEFSVRSATHGTPPHACSGQVTTA
jgi:hypothetical protein